MILSVKGKACSALHFVGILGSGMSAIAQYLKWNGLDISGSDRLIKAQSTNLLRNKLSALGCCIFDQDGTGIDENTDGIVVSSAIEKSNLDISQAEKMKIPIYHRSDILAAIVNTRKTIAVAGTNGKSTVTGLIFHLLRACDKHPSIISGGNLNSLINQGFIGNAFNGNSDILVIEADESDGSLTKYHPHTSIFLNLFKDHNIEEETLKLFSILASQSAHVFVNHGDRRLTAIKPAKTFGLSHQADFHPDYVKSTKKKVEIVKNSLPYILPFPGEHMAANFIAALSICSFLGCNDDNLSQAASTYSGIHRRFDQIVTPNGVTVIDDYAHNPEKIRATLKTTQVLSEKVFVLFQPHGFGPTKFMFHEFVEVFSSTLRKNDSLFILPIYYAGGTAKRTISSQDITKNIKSSTNLVFAPESREECIPKIISQVQQGDIILSMGARDPSLPMFAASLAEAITAKNRGD